jgi:hypothetical protein
MLLYVLKINNLHDLKNNLAEKRPVPHPDRKPVSHLPFRGLISRASQPPGSTHCSMPPDFENFSASSVPLCIRRSSAGTQAVAGMRSCRRSFFIHLLVPSVSLFHLAHQFERRIPVIIQRAQIPVHLHRASCSAWVSNRKYPTVLRTAS